jgi:hypothetical protein
MHLRSTAMTAFTLLLSMTLQTHAEELLVPVIDGPWWQVAGDPDLGEYTRAEQQPVDFGVWQAADGTWQLWSCIRHTACGGHTRLFYRWEGQQLTDHDWRPMGIAMEAKPELGESPGGLQAPHVVQHAGQYVMAYGDWVNICFATSRDGKNFERHILPDGKTGVFSEGPGCNTRDPMLIQIDDLWHCYYTAVVNGRGYGFCRTSPDLKIWSDSYVVSYGGRVGPGPWQNECPHVVQMGPGQFFYFRNELYGKNARNWVYHSDNPYNFGIDEDSKLVRDWHLAAPEIIRHENQFFIAALMDDLKGIKIARLKWARISKCGPAVFDFDSETQRQSWSLESGNLASIFTNSTRSDFQPRSEFFVGTAEVDNDSFDDKRVGEIHSPEFTVDGKNYLFLISGGDNAKQLYVALTTADTKKDLVRLTGDQSNRFAMVRVDCSAWLGQRVFLRIVDQAQGPWGHINFGGLFEDPLNQFEK